jgi:hypothetical protein
VTCGRADISERKGKEVCTPGEDSLSLGQLLYQILSSIHLHLSVSLFNLAFFAEFVSFVLNAVYFACCILQNTMGRRKIGWRVCSSKFTVMTCMEKKMEETLPLVSCQEEIYLVEDNDLLSRRRLFTLEKKEPSSGSGERVQRLLSKLHPLFQKSKRTRDRSQTDSS